MDETGTAPALRVVRPEETAGTQTYDAAPSTETYWARVQQLRGDLARLRPAN